MAIRPTFLVRPEFKIQQAIGPHEDLLTIVKGRKLQWYGHAYRSSGLAKTILQGTVKGGRRQGRQKKRWEDSIREWTGLNSPSPGGQWRTEWYGQNHLQGTVKGGRRQGRQKKRR